MKLSSILRKLNDGIGRRELNERNYDRLGCHRYSTSTECPIERNATSTNSRASSIDEEIICRICRLSSIKAREELISPCACKGTLAYIHRSCLEKWLKRSGTTHCELCQFTYTVKVIERYSKLNSIKKWLTDEDNLDDVQDMIVDGVLALTFLPIVIVLCYSFANAYAEIPHLNLLNTASNPFLIRQKLWVVFMLACFAISVVAGYSCWLAVRSIHYHRRWSNWIRRHGKLILILEDPAKKIR